MKYWITASSQLVSSPVEKGVGVSRLLFINEDETVEDETTGDVTTAGRNDRGRNDRDETTGDETTGYLKKK